MFQAIIISLAAGLGLIFGLLGGTTLAISKIKLPAIKKNITEHKLASEPKKIDDFTEIAKELDGWRRELEEKKNQALRYDADLLKREQIVKAEREALDKQRQQLISMQKDIEDHLIKIKNDEIAKLDETAALYSTMKTDDAVDLLQGQQHDDQVVKVLSRMRPKIQAKVLGAWIKKYPNDVPRVSQLTADMKRVTLDEGAASTP